MEEKKIDNELFNPEEMQSPFDSDSGELQLSDAIRKIPILSEKWDEQGVLLYNLDAIIAVGYRVKSYEATQFRIWAREVLKEYIVKGYVLDDERLKGLNNLIHAEHETDRGSSGNHPQGR